MAVVMIAHCYCDSPNSRVHDVGVLFMVKAEVSVEHVNPNGHHLIIGGEDEKF